MSSSKGLSAGEMLGEKIRELMANPPKFDANGREITGLMSFGEAFAYVTAQEPELARQYSEEMCVPIVLNQPERPQRPSYPSAGELLAKKVRELLENPPAFAEGGPFRHGATLSYSEAFNIVSTRNPELTAQYMLELEGKL